LAFGHDQGFTRVAASGKLANMFVIELTYKAPLKNIDASMPAHMKFLKKYYAVGHFLISGHKIPRAGGIWRLAIAANKSKRSREDLSMRKDWSTFGSSSSGRASVRMLFRG
jgi:uncharacterized protein YciI